MSRIIAVFLLAALSAGQAEGASIYVGASGFGQAPAAGGGSSLIEDFDERYSDDTAVTGLARSALARAERGGTFYQGAASADFSTGRLQADLDAGSARMPGNEARAEVEAYETFVARGAGTVDINLDLKGSWNIGALDPGDPDFSRLVLYGRLFVSGPSGFEDPIFRIIEEGPGARLSGNVSSRVTFTRQVADGDTFGFNTFLVASLSGSEGDSFARWSGLLSVVGRDGTRIEFGDPGFLADARPAPVPLPAPGLLLLGAVGAAGVALRRRRRA